MKFPSINAVAASPHHRAEVTDITIIPFCVIITQHHIPHRSIPVRQHNRNDRRPQICQANRHVIVILDCVKCQIASFPGFSKASPRYCHISPLPQLVSARASFRCPYARYALRVCQVGRPISNHASHDRASLKKYRVFLSSSETLPEFQHNFLYGTQNPESAHAIDGQVPL